MTENRLNIIEKLFLRLYCYPPPGKVVSSDMSRSLKIDPLCSLREKYGDKFTNCMTDKVVLDVGCGTGEQVIGAVLNGAKKGIGVDIRSIQENSVTWAKELGVSDRVSFTTKPIRQIEENSIDIAYSQNSLEHILCPEAILKDVYCTLKKNGKFFITFGPPWLAPYGVHMYFMIKYPWAHLLFSESTILNVRKLYRNDNARKYEEVDGGLNKITFNRFKTIVKKSDFKFEYLKLTATKGIKPLVKIPYLQELFITQITAILIKRNAEDTNISSI